MWCRPAERLTTDDEASVTLKAGRRKGPLCSLISCYSEVSKALKVEGGSDIAVLPSS